MSTDATIATWKLSKAKVTATEKLFLLSCADRASEDGVCWPSIMRLTADTCLDRKTVIDVRQSVINKLLLEYTGEMKGKTKLIPVMRLTYVDHRCNNSPENGTYSYLNSPENGTPNSPENGTLKQSRKRDTESKTMEPKSRTNIYINARETEQKSTTTPVNDWHNHVGLYENQNGLQTTDTNLCTQEHEKAIGQPLNHSDLQLISLYQLKAYELVTWYMFINLYPVKKQLERAKAQWFHDGCHHMADMIIDKLKTQLRKDQQYVDGYVPQPINYIVRKRWEDEVQPKRKTNGQIDWDAELSSTDWIDR